MVLSCIISEIKPYIGRESPFFIPHLHSMPPLEMYLSEYCHNFWRGKTKMVDLPGDVKVWWFIYSLRHNNTNVTDRHRRTDILRQHSSRYVYASRGKKKSMVCSIKVLCPLFDEIEILIIIMVIIIIIIIIQDNVYGAVIMAEPLRHFTRFIWWM